MDKSISYKLNYLTRLMMAQINQAIKPHGASQGQLPVLCCLLDEEGQTQAELRKKIQVEQPTMANTLRRMERDGQIYRVPCKQDKRQSRIFLDERIRPAVLALREKRDDVLSQMTRKMSPEEIETFHRLLDVATQSLERCETNQSEK